MIIKYILQYLSNSLAKYILGGVALGLLSSIAYYAVGVHFSNKEALRTAILTQKKQKIMDSYAQKLTREYNTYKQKLMSKEIECRSDDCTLEELKNALHE